GHASGAPDEPVHPQVPKQAGCLSNWAGVKLAHRHSLDKGGLPGGEPGQGTSHAATEAAQLEDSSHQVAPRKEHARAGEQE
ncbi:hypothetical protein HC891_10945, partial [Candidatus Gracilibacteria bacterium]|nr:hypothetical protein [Candidatus Gracilibacteria bacterium]